MSEDKKKTERLVAEIGRLEDKVVKLDNKAREVEAERDKLKEMVRLLRVDNDKMAGRVPEDLLLNGEGVPPDWLVRVVTAMGRGARLPTGQAPLLFNKILTWASDYVQREVTKPIPRPSFLALIRDVRTPHEMEPMPEEPSLEEVVMAVEGLKAQETADVLEGG